jgi:hypothetical protein
MSRLWRWRVRLADWIRPTPPPVDADALQACRRANSDLLKQLQAATDARDNLRWERSVLVADRDEYRRRWEATRT